VTCRLVHMRSVLGEIFESTTIFDSLLSVMGVVGGAMMYAILVRCDASMREVTAERVEEKTMRNVQQRHI